ncbi:hypothetical protein ABT065_26985 [Streptomyces sp. NPDC002764]|uniref:hypothetical protein n=1 Tax=Streptomyces sp. NPDC002764 TaxID=3154428 RepID=UPI0033234490
MRTDQPRQTGMDHWKGPHSGIIAATPGLEEYRQLHLAEHNPGRWPATDGIQTAIPADRKIDGVAEVTFQTALAPLKGRKQTKLAYADEINVFRRTLLYAGPPRSSRWYDVAGPGQTVGARALIYLRRRDGVGAGAFRKFVNEQLAPALAGTGVLTELRTQTFLPWSERSRHRVRSLSPRGPPDFRRLRHRGRPAYQHRGRIRTRRRPLRARADWPGLTTQWRSLYPPTPLRVAAGEVPWQWTNYTG